MLRDLLRCHLTEPPMQEICTPPTAENHWGLDDVWGFRHVVARRFLGAGYVNVDNYMEGLVERGGMMLLIDDTLKHAVDVEERRLTDLAQEYGLGCRTWPDRRGPSLQELVDLLGDPGFDADFVHFASHAGSTGSRRASELWLKLAKCEKELRVTYGDLGNKVETLCSNPLVFMNGCSTGEEPLLQTRSLVSLFLEKGARGVIATECTVPDVFAAEFAAEFYKRFFYFGRDGVGEALLRTRQHFLEDHNNPLGLAYTLYADGETRIGW
jgi:hypothetical protein